MSIRYRTVPRRNPDVQRAGAFANNAARTGKLYWPWQRECTFAHQGDCKGRMQYHHYAGYEREHWLDVIPVCVHHHHAINRGRLQLPAQFPGLIRANGNDPEHE